MAEFIQIYNIDRDPVFVELISGQPCWLLPSDVKISSVKYVTHIEETTGTPYYENIATQAVSWTLPAEIMSGFSIKKCNSILSMTRAEVEVQIHGLYPEVEATAQLLALDKYIESGAEDKGDEISLLTDPQFDPGDQLDTAEIDEKSAIPIMNKSQSTSQKINDQKVIDQKISKSSQEKTTEPIQPKQKSIVTTTPVQLNSTQPIDESSSNKLRPSSGSSFRRQLSVENVAASPAKPNPIDLKTADSAKRTIIKSGYLMKLAKISNRNWKSRFFVLNPYNLTYYEDEKSIFFKGEIQISADSVVTLDKADKKFGYAFKITNANDSLIMAARTEIDRSHWIKVLESAIKYSKGFLKEYLTLVGDVNKSKKVLGGKGGQVTLMNSKKYFILSPHLLTYHPDSKTTSTIEGVMNITEHTKIDFIDDKTKTISLIDADRNATKVTFRFGSMSINDDRQYRVWKTAILKMIEASTSAKELISNTITAVPSVKSTPATNLPAISTARNNDTAIDDNSSFQSKTNYDSPPKRIQKSPSFKNNNLIQNNFYNNSEDGMDSIDPEQTRVKNEEYLRNVLLKEGNSRPVSSARDLVEGTILNNEEETFDVDVLTPLPGDEVNITEYSEAIIHGEGYSPAYYYTGVDNPHPVNSEDYVYPNTQDASNVSSVPLEYSLSRDVPSSEDGIKVPSEDVSDSNVRVSNRMNTQSGRYRRGTSVIATSMPKMIGTQLPILQSKPFRAKEAFVSPSLTGNNDEQVQVEDHNNLYFLPCSAEELAQAYESKRIEAEKMSDTVLKKTSLLQDLEEQDESDEEFEKPILMAETSLPSEVHQYEKESIPDNPVTLIQNVESSENLKENFLESDSSKSRGKDRPISIRSPIFESNLAQHSMDTGGVLIGKMFSKESKFKPLAQVVFDLYCRSDRHIDIVALQHLSYDFGIYYSQYEIKISVRGYASRNNGTLMSYDDFIVWWRSHEKFSTFKLDDPIIMKRIACAAIFKSYDTELIGSVDAIIDFPSILKELSNDTNKYISKKFLLEDPVLMILNPNNDGYIDFNAFIKWIDTTTPDDLKAETLKKSFFNLFGNFSPLKTISPSTSSNDMNVSEKNRNESDMSMKIETDNPSYRYNKPLEDHFEDALDEVAMVTVEDTEDGPSKDLDPSVQELVPSVYNTTPLKVSTGVESITTAPTTTATGATGATFESRRKRNNRLSLYKAAEKMAHKQKKDLHDDDEHRPVDNNHPHQQNQQEISDESEHSLNALQKAALRKSIKFATSPIIEPPRSEEVKDVSPIRNEPLDGTYVSRDSTSSFMSDNPIASSKYKNRPLPQIKEKKVDDVNPLDTLSTASKVPINQPPAQEKSLTSVEKGKKVKQKDEQAFKAPPSFAGVSVFGISAAYDETSSDDDESERSPKPIYPNYSKQVDETVKPTPLQHIDVKIESSPSVYQSKSPIPLANTSLSPNNLKSNEEKKRPKLKFRALKVALQAKNNTANSPKSVEFKVDPEDKRDGLSVPTRSPNAETEGISLKNHPTEMTTQNKNEGINPTKSSALSLFDSIHETSDQSKPLPPPPPPPRIPDTPVLRKHNESKVGFDLGNLENPTSKELDSSFGSQLDRSMQPLSLSKMSSPKSDNIQPFTRPLLTPIESSGPIVLPSSYQKSPVVTDFMNSMRSFHEPKTIPVVTTHRVLNDPNAEYTVGDEIDDEMFSPIRITAIKPMNIPTVSSATPAKATPSKNLADLVPNKKDTFTEYSTIGTVTDKILIPTKVEEERKPMTSLLTHDFQKIMNQILQETESLIHSKTDDLLQFIHIPKYSSLDLISIYPPPPPLDDLNDLQNDDDDDDDDASMRRYSTGSMNTASKQYAHTGCQADLLTAGEHLLHSDHQKNAFQILLKERNVIANALQNLYQAESSSLQLIQQREEESIKKIEFEKQSALEIISKAEKQFEEILSAKMQTTLNETAYLEKVHKKLQNEQKQFEIQQTERIDAFKLIAAELSNQQVIVMEERKKCLKQQLQLNMTLQLLNSNEFIELRNHEEVKRLDDYLLPPSSMTNASMRGGEYPFTKDHFPMERSNTSRSHSHDINGSDEDPHEMYQTQSKRHEKKKPSPLKSQHPLHSSSSSSVNDLLRRKNSRSEMPEIDEFYPNPNQIDLNTFGYNDLSPRTAARMMMNHPNELLSSHPVISSVFQLGLDENKSQSTTWLPMQSTGNPYLETAALPLHHPQHPHMMESHQLYEQMTHYPNPPLSHTSSHHLSPPIPPMLAPPMRQRVDLSVLLDRNANQSRPSYTPKTQIHSTPPPHTTYTYPTLHNMSIHSDAMGNGNQSRSISPLSTRSATSSHGLNPGRLNKNATIHSRAFR